MAGAPCAITSPELVQNFISRAAVQKRFITLPNNCTQPLEYSRGFFSKAQRMSDFQSCVRQLFAPRFSFARKQEKHIGFSYNRFFIIIQKLFNGIVLRNFKLGENVLIFKRPLDDDYLEIQLMKKQYHAQESLLQTCRRVPRDIGSRA